MLNVVTVLTDGWCDDLGPEYVKRLYDGIEKHLTVPHTFSCLTDVPALMPKGVTPIEKLSVLEGWWNKLYLFKVMTGRVFFLDLDTIICGPLDELASYDGKMMGLRDFYWPRFASGVMLWDAEKMAYIWKRYEEYGFPTNRGGDGNFIGEFCKDSDFIQYDYPGLACSYKVHIRDKKRPAPENPSLICFHGQPRPHEVPAFWPR